MTFKLSPERQRALEIIRSVNPQQAAAIERALARAPNVEAHTAIPIKVTITRRLEKFDGEYRPGMMPVEIITDTETIGG